MLLADPRGFCAGVEMAIKALAWMVRSFPAPVYCYHEIVHNRIVVDRFEQQGVVFVEDRRCPMAQPIMLSAHGSAPDVVDAARSKGSFVVDSVCPLVTKVHHEVKVRAGKGFRIVYVGHVGHEEAIGTMAVAPDAISRVESVEEVDALPEFEEPVALLAQTTLSHRDWEGVAVGGEGAFPRRLDARQERPLLRHHEPPGVVRLAHGCDAIVVIGSANSSNTGALAKLAEERLRAGVPRQHGRRAPHGPVRNRRSDGRRVGARRTGGRSARLPRPDERRRTGRVTDEDEYFPPPRNIRELQNAIETAATGLLGGSLIGGR